MSEAKKINELLNKIVLKNATVEEYKNFLKQELFKNNYYIDHEHNSFNNILFTYTSHEDGSPNDESYGVALKDGVNFINAANMGRGYTSFNRPVLIEVPD